MFGTEVHVNPFPSILVPLDGSRLATRSLGCATWLASALGAGLHVLSATEKPLPAREELARLHVAEAHWPLIELHQDAAYPPNAILEMAERLDASLLIMTTHGAAAEAPATPDDARTPSPEQPPVILGHVTQAVIERAACPVLLLPPSYRERLPWQRLLVPVSGGVQCDAALEVAVNLAGALDLSVHVVHVVDAAPPADANQADQALAVRMRYSDALYHELDAHLEELVARALPCLPPDERRRIQSIALGHGTDVAQELIQVIARERMSVLVAGWHGEFSAGRARVLKDVIARVDTPVLLVKCPGSPPDFRLKVGEALD